MGPNCYVNLPEGRALVPSPDSHGPPRSALHMCLVDREPHESQRSPLN